MGVNLWEGGVGVEAENIKHNKWGFIIVTIRYNERNIRYKIT
jgi:hypothetical protein